MKELDFDDHFQFAGVCKNWRAFHENYGRNFLASQEPLLLQISDHVEESYSFISIPDQKVYPLEMMKGFLCSCVTFSSGYFITTKSNNSFMLINPFTRIKNVINTPISEVKSCYSIDRALLAFGKCSKEFVLVVLCEHRLHVFQSRSCGWVSYSTTGDQGRVVDFVVLHNIIYIVTHKANIGVLSLNYANIKFPKLKSTPNVTFSHCRLVNCDEQLLVVDVMFQEIRNVYKIDFSTMDYVKLKTLGDIALFVGSDSDRSNCYALSNPNRWGYERNLVYVIDHLSVICSVYSRDDKKLKKRITLLASHGTSFLKFEWCFRHLEYNIDYSLVE